MSTSRPLSAIATKPKVTPPLPKPPSRQGGQRRRIQSSYSQPNLHSFAAQNHNNKTEPTTKEVKKKKVKKKKKAVLVANLALTKYSLGILM